MLMAICRQQFIAEDPAIPLPYPHTTATDAHLVAVDMQFTQWRGRIRWLGSIPTSGHSIHSLEAGGGRESGNGGREYQAGDRVGCRELAIDLGLYMRESCLFITWNRSRFLSEGVVPLIHARHGSSF
jgi:hypothetical protein